MIDKIKKYAPPALFAFCTVTLAVTSMLVSIWLSIRFAGLPRNSAETAAADAVREILAGTFNVKTPVPYFWLSAVGVLLFSVEGFRNRYLYGSYASLENRHRAEKQAHGTSKRSYYNSLTDALKFLLGSGSCGFSNDCRVTIYRKEAGVENHLKKIFRYSAHNSYCNSGRFSIPSDEGIVGIAWGGSGLIEFRGSRKGAMEKFLAEHRVKMPEMELSMNSVVYFAKAIDDHDSGRRVGVIVYESTREDCLNFEELGDMLNREAATISRFVKHLAKLDTEFNPDRGDRE